MDFSNWYNSIPKLTRFWLTATVIGSLGGRLGLINLTWVYLDWDLFFNHFHFWRPLTALFVFPITPQTGFHFLINLFFLYNYSSRLETGLFASRPADYAFMFLFNWLCLVVVGFIGGLFFLLDPMVLSVMYVWCQINKDEIVSFWFGMRFKAMYLPWVLAGFNFILRGGGFVEILGIAVGHLYFFLKYKYPLDLGGPDLLQTPAFMYKWLPNTRAGVSGFGIPPSSRRTDGPEDGARRGGPAWGAGQRLGD